MKELKQLKEESFKATCPECGKVFKNVWRHFERVHEPKPKEKTQGSSAFYTSEGFIIGRALYWEEFVLRLFIFDVFCQGIELVNWTSCRYWRQVEVTRQIVVTCCYSWWCV